MGTSGRATGKVAAAVKSIMASSDDSDSMGYTIWEEVIRKVTKVTVEMGTVLPPADVLVLTRKFMLWSLYNHLSESGIDETVYKLLCWLKDDWSIPLIAFPSKVQAREDAQHYPCIGRPPSNELMLAVARELAVVPMREDDWPSYVEVFKRQLGEDALDTEEGEEMEEGWVSKGQGAANGRSEKQKTGRVASGRGKYAGGHEGVEESEEPLLLQAIRETEKDLHAVYQNFDLRLQVAKKYPLEEARKLLDAYLTNARAEVDSYLLNKGARDDKARGVYKSMAARVIAEQWGKTARVQGGRREPEAGQDTGPSKKGRGTVAGLEPGLVPCSNGSQSKQTSKENEKGAKRLASVVERDTPGAEGKDSTIPVQPACLAELQRLYPHNVNIRKFQVRVSSGPLAGVAQEPLTQFLEETARGEQAIDEALTTQNGTANPGTHMGPLPEVDRPGARAGVPAGNHTVNVKDMPKLPYPELEQPEGPDVRQEGVAAVRLPPWRGTATGAGLRTTGLRVVGEGEQEPHTQPMQEESKGRGKAQVEDADEDEFPALRRPKRRKKFTQRRDLGPGIDAEDGKRGSGSHTQLQSRAPGPDTVAALGALREKSARLRSLGTDPLPEALVVAQQAGGGLSRSSPQAGARQAQGPAAEGADEAMGTAGMPGGAAGDSEGNQSGANRGAGRIGTGGAEEGVGDGTANQAMGQARGTDGDGRRAGERAANQSGTSAAQAEQGGVQAANQGEEAPETGRAKASAMQVDAEDRQESRRQGVANQSANRAANEEAAQGVNGEEDGGGSGGARFAGGRRPQRNLMERHPSARQLHWGSEDEHEVTDPDDDTPPPNGLRLPSVSPDGAFAPLADNADERPAANRPPAGNLVRRRAHNAWRPQETNALVAGVRTFGRKWELILAENAHVFVNRTSVDLKDKFRNIEKAQRRTERRRNV